MGQQMSQGFRGPERGCREIIVAPGSVRCRNLVARSMVPQSDYNIEQRRLCMSIHLSQIAHKTLSSPWPFENIGKRHRDDGAKIGSHGLWLRKTGSEPHCNVTRLHATPVLV